MRLLVIMKNGNEIFFSPPNLLLALLLILQLRPSNVDFRLRISYVHLFLSGWVYCIVQDATEWVCTIAPCATCAGILDLRLI